MISGSLILHFNMYVLEQWQPYHDSYICSGLIRVSYPPDYCCGERVCDSSLCLLFLEKYVAAYVIYLVMNIAVINVCVCACVCICVRACVCVSAHVCVRVRVCLCVCVCERERDKVQYQNFCKAW